MNIMVPFITAAAITGGYVPITGNSPKLAPPPTEKATLPQPDTIKNEGPTTLGDASSMVMMA